mmetsp:Transcript_44512/g.90861  ORF Transcript_44512/g.90861 Transcript_44512/m.90861 type:complete len:275 (-) Transcript_44512:3768-4592(-)
MIHRQNDEDEGLGRSVVVTTTIIDESERDLHHSTHLFSNGEREMPRGRNGRDFGEEDVLRIKAGSLDHICQFKTKILEVFIWVRSCRDCVGIVGERNTALVRKDNNLAPVLKGETRRIVYRLNSHVKELWSRASLFCVKLSFATTICRKFRAGAAIVDEDDRDQRTSVHVFCWFQANDTLAPINNKLWGSAEKLRVGEGELPSEDLRCFLERASRHMFCKRQFQLGRVFIKSKIHCLEAWRSIGTNNMDRKGLGLRAIVTSSVVDGLCTKNSSA